MYAGQEGFPSARPVLMGKFLSCNPERKIAPQPTAFWETGPRWLQDPSKKFSSARKCAAGSQLWSRKGVNLVGWLYPSLLTWYILPAHTNLAQLLALYVLHGASSTYITQSWVLAVRPTSRLTPGISGHSAIHRELCIKKYKKRQSKWALTE